jgi:hypothetical protein
VLFPRKLLSRDLIAGNPTPRISDACCQIVSIEEMHRSIPVIFHSLDSASADLLAAIQEDVVSRSGRRDQDPTYTRARVKATRQVGNEATGIFKASQSESGFGAGEHRRNIDGLSVCVAESSVCGLCNNS